MKAAIALAVLLSFQEPIGSTSPLVRSRFRAPLAATGCACIPEAALNHSAGPNDPTCSGPNPGGAGYIWGYNCGTPAQARWLIVGGCVVAVVP